MNAYSASYYDFFLFSYHDKLSKGCKHKKVGHMLLLPTQTIIEIFTLK